MTGLAIQYLLGIYFLVVAITIEDSKIKADIVKGVAGAILLVTAILGLTLLK